MTRGKHSFNGRIGAKKNRRCPWIYCVKCGLVPMKNVASQKAVSKPCDSDMDDDVEYVRPKWDR